MKLKVEIEMNSRASDDGWKHDEAARLLRKAAKQIQAGAWRIEIEDNPDTRLVTTLTPDLPS